jgi:uncharacterized protein (DUF433 family)
MTVYIIAARVADGDPVAEILEGYPDLPPEHVQAAIDYASRLPFVEHPDGRPWLKQKVKERSS